jgi:hypothetical protein
MAGNCLGSAKAMKDIHDEKLRYWLNGEALWR